MPYFLKVARRLTTISILPSEANSFSINSLSEGGDLVALFSCECGAFRHDSLSLSPLTRALIKTLRVQP